MLEASEDKAGKLTKSLNLKENGTKNGTCYPLQLISAFNFTFTTFVTIKEGFFHFWVYIFGDESQAKQFKVHLKIKDKNGFGLSCSVYASTIWLKPFYVYYQAENAFSFNVKNGLKYAKDGILDVSIKICNLKEEAKDEDKESGISDNDN